MNILTTTGWEDYELLDSGDSMRLERFGKYIISKPDPQAVWKPSRSMNEWNNADAIFKDGKWKTKQNFPDKWVVNFKNLKFYAKLTPFKHTGIFPEQILNWEFIESKLNNLNYEAKVLNLFAYTGAASIVAAKTKAKVTHVDASKSSISWAKDNQLLSNLSPDSIRWILDDALEFTEREQRRGNTYDAIIMDPPVYGHGPSGEVWNFDKSFPKLLENCNKILSKKPLFIVANAYAISASSIMLKNLFEDYFEVANVDYGELSLKQKNERLLSTGIYARISF